MPHTCHQALVGLKQEHYHDKGENSTDWAMPARPPVIYLVIAIVWTNCCVMFITERSRRIHCNYNASNG